MTTQKKTKRKTVKSKEPENAVIMQTTIEEVPDENGGFKVVKKRTVIKTIPSESGAFPAWGSPEAIAYTRNLVQQLDEDDRNL